MNISPFLQFSYILGPTSHSGHQQHEPQQQFLHYEFKHLHNIIIAYKSIVS